MSEQPYVGPPDPVPAISKRRPRALLTALIIAVALAGVGISASLDRLDSALLFVGIPCLLAFAVSRLPGNGGWASVMQATTIVLLLASALLHEGALCVLLAAPLVYGAAGFVYWLTTLASSHRYVVAPFLVLLALEGALPSGRIGPEQDATATAVVAEDCDQFRAALARGPQPDPAADRGLLLRIAQYPTPTAATGTGLDVGDTWTLAMPAGAIVTEVVEAEDDRLRFAVTGETARTTRWVDLREGTLSWRATPDGCSATLAIGYDRKLDPSWWFGPVTEAFMDAGAAAFLAGLD